MRTPCDNPPREQQSFGARVIAGRMLALRPQIYALKGPVTIRDRYSGYVRPALAQAALLQRWLLSAGKATTAVEAKSHAVALELAVRLQDACALFAGRLQDGCAENVVPAGVQDTVKLADGHATCWRHRRPLLVDLTAEGHVAKHARTAGKALVSIQPKALPW